MAFINTQMKSIIYFLRDIIPSIRGKILAIHHNLHNRDVYSLDTIPKDIFDTDECIYEYFNYNASKLPSYIEIANYIRFNDESMPLYYVQEKDSFFDYNSMNRLYRPRSDIEKHNTYISYKDYIFERRSHSVYIYNVGRMLADVGNGRYRIYSNIEREIDNIYLDVHDILLYYQQKSSVYVKYWNISNDGNYVIEMSLKYIDSILSELQLHSKIEYLVLSLDILEDKHVDIATIDCDTDTYNELYTKVVSYITNIE